ncbi:uncharacterized protein JN550_012664 [Neoarthrinium moseri]|uniref:uncharacterized protein n=1 Tax=Neoarthrinium moseri TaxID=1658444 RepID=UPI001FDCDA7B|nr:uncharacterized protein JN550_012664 [Neoarthrinium moseri]KAI1858454.1 hypothetical protein JN550_012664 [Neoarthrinium moseri]
MTFHPHLRLLYVKPDEDTSSAASHEHIEEKQNVLAFTLGAETGHSGAHQCAEKSQRAYWVEDPDHYQTEGDGVNLDRETGRIDALRGNSRNPDHHGYQNAQVEGATTAAHPETRAIS